MPGTGLSSQHARSYLTYNDCQSRNCYCAPFLDEGAREQIREVKVTSTRSHSDGDQDWNWGVQPQSPLTSSPQPRCKHAYVSMCLSDSRSTVWTYRSQAEGKYWVVTSKLKVGGVWKAACEGQSESWTQARRTLPRVFSLTLSAMFAGQQNYRPLVPVCVLPGLESVSQWLLRMNHSEPEPVSPGKQCLWCDHMGKAMIWMSGGPVS